METHTHYGHKTFTDAPTILDLRPYEPHWLVTFALFAALATAILVSPPQFQFLELIFLIIAL